MITHQLTGLITRLRPHALLVPKVVLATHTSSCPVGKFKTANVSVAKGTQAKDSGIKGSGGTAKGGLKRALTSGKCRMSFVPEEWFTFFHSKTGVTGPYIFGFVLTNYCLSKEIYVMEHEYYLGISIFIVVACVNTKFGDAFAAHLDKGVDDLVADMEKDRKLEIAIHESNMKTAKDAQWRAEGQKLLMDAKKENIAMQLEAIYRERMMHVYKTVKGRMDYHLKRHQSEARIHQKWMIGWILEQVRKSITPEFERQALAAAIQDLVAASSRAK